MDTMDPMSGMPMGQTTLDPMSGLSMGGAGGMAPDPRMEMIKKLLLQRAVSQMGSMGGGGQPPMLGQPPSLMQAPPTMLPGQPPFGGGR